MTDQTCITGAMVEAAASAAYADWIAGLECCEPRWDDLDDGHRARLLECQRAALEAAERAAWVPVHEAPAAWEGTVVLLARDGALERGHLPVGFSRDPEHCRGVLVRPMPQP